MANRRNSYGRLPAPRWIPTTPHRTLPTFRTCAITGSWAQPTFWSGSQMLWTIASEYCRSAPSGLLMESICILALLYNEWLSTHTHICGSVHTYMNNTHFKMYHELPHPIPVHSQYEPQHNHKHNNQLITFSSKLMFEYPCWIKVFHCLGKQSAGCCFT